MEGEGVKFVRWNVTLLGVVRLWPLLLGSEQERILLKRSADVLRFLRLYHFHSSLGHVFIDFGVVVL